MKKNLSAQEFAKVSLEKIKNGSIIREPYTKSDIDKDKEIYDMLARRKFENAERKILQYLGEKPYDTFWRNFLTYIQIKTKKFDIAEELIKGTKLLEPKNLKCRTYELYIKFLLGQEEEVIKKRKEIDEILQTPQSPNVPNHMLYGIEINFLKAFDETLEKRKNRESNLEEDLDIMY